jgi:hypothetical protein
MKSGETAGHGNGRPCVPNRTQAKRAGPDRGSQAGGVSRAERGNDGSPTGARRRKRLDALRARQRDRPCFLAGDAQPLRFDEHQTQGVHHAPGIGKLVLLWLRIPGRSGAAGSAASRGAKHRAAGIARRAFPLEASEARSAVGTKKPAPGAAEKKVRRPTGRRTGCLPCVQLVAGATID